MSNSVGTARTRERLVRRMISLCINRFIFHYNYKITEGLEARASGAA